MMMTFMEVKGQRRSNEVNYDYYHQTWPEEPLMQVKDENDLLGGQRSTEVKCRPIVNYAFDACYQIWSEEPLMKV